MSRRILLASLFHETHSFVDEITAGAALRWRHGTALLDRAGDGSTVDGFLAVARREGWVVIPALEMGATPSGLIDHAEYERFCDALLSEARAALAGGLDGIWLSLHGAMVTTGEHDPEGALLARLRALPGAAKLPVFGVFDLHATFTARMARHADGLVAYRENPHTDAQAAAVFSAELLARALKEGRRPRMLTRTLPIVWPPTGTATADEPMRSLCEEARRIEARDPDIWAVNIVAGYSFADTSESGVSLSLITTGDDAIATAHLARLAEIAEAGKQSGVPREWPLEAAIADALARPVAGPIAFVEPADNIGGGAPGDCTTILRAFVAHRLTEACVIINDPGAVTALADLPIGGMRRLAVGGRGSPLDPGPFDLDLTLIARSDGRFTLEDRHSHMAANGVHVDMGPSATVKADGVTILLTSSKTAPFDLGQLRSQGIVPETLRYIGIKAAVAHRRAYDPIAGRSYTVTTPGPCPSDLTILPYRHLRRPIFPLDPPWRPL